MRDEKRRQKSIMKKKKKDKERKKALRIKSNFSYSSFEKDLLIKAKNFPINDCLINQNWKESGLATILLSRKKSDNKLIIGVYLVDIFCLGLKNTLYNLNVSYDEYEKVKLKIYPNSPYISCDPKFASQIIYGAIDYAKKLGFEPNEDFMLTRFILEEKVEKDIIFNIEFGKDGKPLYISGPNDDINSILNTLRKNVGEGNFNFIVKT